MIVDHLYPEDTYLAPEEAIRRVATSFRRVAIDRVRGDAAIRARLDQLIVAHASDEVIRATVALKGKVSWASVSDDDEPCDTMNFLLGPDEGVFIAYRSDAERVRFRPLAKKLAELLGYQLEEWTTFLDVTIACEYSRSVAEELTLNRMIVDALQDKDIGWVDEFRFEADGISLTVMVADEETGRNRVAAALEELFPDVSLVISVPPHEIPWCP